MLNYDPHNIQRPHVSSGWPRREDAQVAAHAPSEDHRAPLRLDARVRVWREGLFASGGSPWALLRMSGSTTNLMLRARDAGASGFVPNAADEAACSILVERGLLHPRPPRGTAEHPVSVVVPAYGRPASLDLCLQHLAGLNVLVVDDGSPDQEGIQTVVEAHHARYVRLPVNSGPAAARNAGLAATDRPLVAFVDSDCQPEEGWLDDLVPHFDDPRVAVVAPRIKPVAGANRLLERYESMSSALDMGEQPALVRPGAALGFLPSAAIVIRRSALTSGAFEETLRLGEDVDLVWRLADAGWLLRYEPSVVVRHEMRDRWVSWSRRRFEYGTSAAALEERHPGRLTPVRISAWNAASLVLLMSGRPGCASTILAATSGLLARRLRPVGGTPRMATSLVLRGLAADGVSIGHALRREYWQVGVATLLASPWSRAARFISLLIIAPILGDWLRSTRKLDPLRYTAIRLVADASYGAGVQTGAWRSKIVGLLIPRLRQVR